MARGGYPGSDRKRCRGRWLRRKPHRPDGAVGRMRLVHLSTVGTPIDCRYVDEQRNIRQGLPQTQRQVDA